MTTDEKIQYWTDLSDEDLRAGNTLLKGKHYLYVGFMCHQSIEKIFKACYSKYKKEIPPYTHDLRYLAEKSDILGRFSDEQMLFISLLEPLNIKARYPDYKKQLEKSLTIERCEYLLEQTEILQRWTKDNLL